MNNSFKNAGTPKPRAMVQGFAAKAFSRSKSVSNYVQNAGEVAEYVSWQHRVFGKALIFSTRERLWSKLVNQMNDGRSWHGLEFGVAWGYSSAWWLSKLPPSRLSSWDGFDRFTGLPAPWREHDVGMFGANGIPPAIDDKRAIWHVGDVEETVSEIDATLITDGGRFLLFDLDLYEPTKFVWEIMLPNLRSGDLLYFDEAIYPDERRVINDLVLTSLNLEYVGATSLALAVKII